MSNNTNEARKAREAIKKIEAWEIGTQEEKVAAWYYTMFCQAWGYGVKKEGLIFSRRGWISTSQLKSHLGLKGKEPHYLAIRPSAWVGWAVIDIDEGSRYHPAAEEGEGIEPVKKALLKIGLVGAIEFQSSTSSGIHLWYPLANLTRVWDLAEQLETCLLQEGLEIGNGVLEIRPNRKNYGSDYLMIRAPLTGEGNSYWAPEYGDFGLLQELRLFHQLWLEMQNDNQLRPLKEIHKRTPVYPPNRRRPVKGKKSLKDHEGRLLKGFTGRGQSQELKLASLLVARLVEEIDSYIELKERTHELLENLPGFTHYCSHQREIEKRTYITKNELTKCLQMDPRGYEKTWKERSNLRRAKKASEAALGAVEKASEEGKIFKSENKAIEYLKTQGGPSRSWWRKPSNKKFLQLMKKQMVEK